MAPNWAGGYARDPRDRTRGSGWPGSADAPGTASEARRSAGPAAKTGRSPQVRRNGRRHRVEGGTEADRCAGDDERDYCGSHRDGVVAEFCRAAASPSGRQHHAGVRARHQRHEPRRNRHARHGTAGDARRPQPLPGLLRLRDVGLPAGQLQRGQAGRSDPRAGLGGLGRECALRRGERDQQVAARDAGHAWHVRVRRLRSARRRRGIALVRQRDLGGRAERTMVVQALGRRLLAGRLRASDRAHPLRSRGGLHRPDRQLSGASPTRGRRSRSSTRGWTTTTRTERSCRSPAASPAPTASCIPASVPSTSRAVRRWAT